MPIPWIKKNTLTISPAYPAHTAGVRILMVVFNRVEAPRAKNMEIMIHR